jgi:hypothetical protein
LPSQDLIQALSNPPDLSSVLPMAIVIMLTLAVIPAMVARMKGHNTLLWYLYGCVFFPSALVQSLLLPTRIKRSSDAPSMSQADELERWARLRDRGLLTDAEFEQKKRQLLRSAPGAGGGL